MGVPEAQPFECERFVRTSHFHEGAELKIRTYVYELAVVAVILVVVTALTAKVWHEWVGALAVWFGFGYVTIVNRMEERQAIQPKPSVECYWKLKWYFGTKEALWISYFILRQSYAAIVGCVVFVGYPVWRRWYRQHYPIKEDHEDQSQPGTV